MTYERPSVTAAKPLAAYSKATDARGLAPSVTLGILAVF